MTATTITLTRNDVLTLDTCLRNLGGRAVAIEADGSTKVIHKPYAFINGARTAIGHTLGKIKKTVNETNDQLKELFRAHAGGEAEIPPKSPEAVAYNKDADAYLAEDVTVTVHQVAEADLRLDHNEIDPGIIAGILPIFHAPETP